MSDMWLNLSQNPQFKSVARSIGVPVPPTLKRAQLGYQSAPLQGARALIAGAPGIEEDVARLGAEVERWQPGGAAARQEGSEARVVEAAVFDARALHAVAQLEELYASCRELLGRLAPGAKVVVLGAVASLCDSAEAASVAGALEGFTRSLAKEVGARGVSVNLLRVTPQSAEGVDGALRFFLTPHSSYISGQVLTLDREVVEAIEAPIELTGERALEGKVALVTGAAQGIGEATAERLAQEGAHVMALDLSQAGEALIEVTARVGGDSLMVDLSSSQAALRIASFVKSRYGRLDVVVHNAGITRDRTLLRMKPERWRQVIEVNLEAVRRVDEALKAHDLLSEDASQIYLSSIAGIAGNAGQTNYAAAKAGVRAYAAWRAAAFERAGSAARCNVVAPGFIETRMTEAIPVAVREVGRRINAFSQGGVPHDVAEAIAFFASPLSRAVNGQTLRVCGAMALGA